MEIADIPRGEEWWLLRETASCRVFDQRVQARISKTLLDMHVSEPEFWASLARKWALHVHAGDVRRAQRMGLGKCPPQRSLQDVEHSDWKALCDRWGVRTGLVGFWMSQHVVSCARPGGGDVHAFVVCCDVSRESEVAYPLIYKLNIFTHPQAHSAQQFVVVFARLKRH